MAKSKIQSLREQAKREEDKAVADLGKNAVDYLKGTITKDELKSKAIDLGLIEE